MPAITPRDPDEDFDPIDDDRHDAGDVVVRRDPDEAAAEAQASLEELLDKLGWDKRDGQFIMAGAVAHAMADRKAHLIEAPTGTGKSLAYLIPAAQHSMATDKPVVVVTATKALQQQIIDSDAPLLARLWPNLDIQLMKGRGNFACAAKAKSVFEGTEEPLFGEKVDPEVWNNLLEWTNTTDTGDRADSPDGVTDQMWSQVSVGPRECVGARNCAFAAECFAERAGEAARNADIVVTNSHLYLLDAGIGYDGAILPAHDTVVFDEGHKLVETASRVFGVEIRHGRGKAIMGACKGMVKDEDLDEIVDADDQLLTHLLSITETGALDPSTGRLNAILEDYREAVKKAARKIANVGIAATDPAAAEQKQRAVNALGGAADDLSAVLGADDDAVVWVEGDGRRKPVLKMAPVEVGSVLSEHVFSKRTAILCSATLTVGGDFSATADELGLIGDHRWSSTSVPSPFDHASRGILYIPMGRDRPLVRKDGSTLPAVTAQVPDPNASDFRESANAVTLRLIEAAEGRALLLFTSWQALNDTTEWLRDRIPYALLAQGDKPTGRLIAEFAADETSVLCATQSFWEGISVPGPACSLVVIDRIPFPRRDDPLLDAQRRLATANKKSDFGTVDLPRAARLLAQGVGRLIRTVDDSGVVAVLDTRLGTKSYRTTLLGGLPPFRKSIHLEEEVLPFLRAIADDRRDKVPAVGPVEVVEDDSAFDGLYEDAAA